MSACDDEKSSRRRRRVRPSLIPPHKSFELNPFCYDCNNDTYATYVLEHDPLARNHVKVNGSCTSNGFSKFVRNDGIIEMQSCIVSGRI